MGVVRALFGGYRPPPTRSQGRIGDLRYSGAPGKDRRSPLMANRIDGTTYDDLDRVRFYPIVRDALAVKLAAIVAADFWFSSPREDVAEAASQILKDDVKRLVGTLAKGGMEWGRQTCEIVWKPHFDVTVSSGQSDGGGQAETVYPYLWGCKFRSFSPRDTRPLIHPVTGEFAGIRQFYPGRDQADRDILIPKAVHYAHNTEFESTFGTPDTKACVPFVDGVEKQLDSMIQFGDRLSNPWKEIRYPAGRTRVGDQEYDNATIAEWIGEALEGGSTVRVPSETYGGSMNPTNVPKWEVKFNQVPAAANNYVADIGLLNLLIRLAISGVPETASGGDAPGEGSNAMSVTQVGLMLKLLQSTLDGIAYTINTHVLNWWRQYNFGRTCPPLTIHFASIDLATAQAVLDALLAALSTGSPVMDADGNLIYMDIAKVAEQQGMPIRVKKAEAQGSPVERAAQALRESFGMSPASTSPDNPNAATPGVRAPNLDAGGTL